MSANFFAFFQILAFFVILGLSTVAFWTAPFYLQTRDI